MKRNNKKKPSALRGILFLIIGLLILFILGSTIVPSKGSPAVMGASTESATQHSYFSFGSLLSTIFSYIKTPEKINFSSFLKVIENVQPVDIRITPTPPPSTGGNPLSVSTTITSTADIPTDIPQNQRSALQALVYWCLTTTNEATCKTTTNHYCNITVAPDSITVYGQAFDVSGVKNSTFKIACSPKTSSTPSPKVTPTYKVTPTPQKTPTPTIRSSSSYDPLMVLTYWCQHTSNPGSCNDGNHNQYCYSRYAPDSIPTNSQPIDLRSAKASTQAIPCTTTPTPTQRAYPTTGTSYTGTSSTYYTTTPTPTYKTYPATYYPTPSPTGTYSYPTPTTIYPTLSTTPAVQGAGTQMPWWLDTLLGFFHL